MASVKFVCILQRNPASQSQLIGDCTSLDMSDLNVLSLATYVTIETWMRMSLFDQLSTYCFLCWVHILCCVDFWGIKVGIYGIKFPIPRDRLYSNNTIKLMMNQLIRETFNYSHCCIANISKAFICKLLCFRAN